MSDELKGPKDFTVTNYATQKGQVDYISSIFESRGITFDKPTYSLLDEEHSKLVNSFFAISGYGPETSLGQLVQTIACENKQTIDLIKLIRTKKPNQDRIRQIETNSHFNAEQVFDKVPEIKQVEAVLEQISK